LPSGWLQFGCSLALGGEFQGWIFAGVALLGCCGVWIWGGPDCQVTGFFLCWLPFSFVIYLSSTQEGVQGGDYMAGLLLVDFLLDSC